MTPVLTWSLVAVIGGFGSVARFMVDRAVASRLARPFPYGTLTVNLTGALALGAVSALALGHTASLLVGTALIGAYTTFSTWMYETHRLAEERRFRLAAANIVVSSTLGVCAALLGSWLAGLLQ